MKRYLVASLLLWPSLAFAQQGSWEQPFWFGTDLDGADAIIAVNLVHVFDGTTGKFLATTSDNPPPCASCVSGCTRLWTPPPIGSPPGSRGIFDAVPNCRTYLFCQGHSSLSDGRILIVGGFYVPTSNLFDPGLPSGPPAPDGSSNQWNNPVTPPNMAAGRWYPTATTLGDGRVLVSAGWSTPGVNVTIPELYTPITNSWTSLPSADMQQYLYPWMFLLPDGNLLYAGPWDSRILKSATWTWGPPALDPTYWPGPGPTPPPPGYTGSAVMYEPGKVMRCGGYDPIATYPAVATTHVIDLNGAHPDTPQKWMFAGSMNRARNNHNLVILPDGKVLAVGGNANDLVDNPVFEAEIFDPKAGTWSLQPPSDIFNPRWEHSTALLLPDGRVVSAGGVNLPTAQIFSPPYMNPGVPRPQITSAPQYMKYGLNYNIEYQTNGGEKASSVCLIRLGATTHGFDQDQRRVPLMIVAGPALTQMTVQAPLNGNIAPPGHYMLFILSEYALNQFALCEFAAYVKVGP